MFDLTAPALSDFNSCSVEFTANTDAARALLAAMFGHGAFQVTMPKTRAIDFARFAEHKGLTTSG